MEAEENDLDEECSVRFIILVRAGGVTPDVEGWAGGGSTIFNLRQKTEYY